MGFHVQFATLAEKLEYLRKQARRSREDQAFTVWNTRDDDLFNVLPEFFQEGLLTERDAHGNFQFSQVETDKVLMGLVHDYLQMLAEEGRYKVGIPRAYFLQTLTSAGLDPDFYGPVLFRNYDAGEFLLVKEAIISVKDPETGPGGRSRTGRGGCHSTGSGKDL